MWPAPPAPSGPRGKTGAAAKIPKISCKLSGSKVTCKVGKSGGGGGGSGGGRATRAAARACACASAAPASSTRRAAARPPAGRATVRLHALRKVRPGKYTLAVDVGEDVTVHLFPVRLR